MTIAAEEVLAALRGVRYPGFTRDIVSFGIVHDVAVHDGQVTFRLDITKAPRDVALLIEEAARAAVLALPGVTGVDAIVASPVQPRPDAGAEAPLLPEVRSVVAVASGKGGVGKSTVAVNLAVALARRGASVGLMDADIYGPSIPLMMGVQEQPELDDQRRVVPFERHGVRLMSLGFLIPPDTAVIWRGPMVMKAVEQLLRDVAWGKLDILVVDMPPGTGDAQLTLSQKVRLAGAVIVTTPQDVALADAIKGVAMFRKVEVPVLGIVENMSYFVCPHCGARTDIFGHGGGRTEAGRLEVPFLGEVPLDPAVREGGDRGTPIAALDPSSPQTQAFDRIAERILAALGVQVSARTTGLGGVFSRLRRT
ncbi:MAG: Mrp/NBP35 family ATP-binding protein [Acidobacteriia bacterium]|nr:Mrp/NBP35 family ATP-binding protein [Terriglobia bacterium]